jgi:hypothetical protein
MTKIDPVQERQRLEKLYAAMADEELDKLLEAANDLSESAREVLKTEIERRGGHVEYVVEPSPPEPDHPNLVAVARFRDLEQATIARGMLQSAGIDCFLADENTVRMDWFWSNMIGNMRLLVREDDAQAATEILAQPIPHAIPMDDGEEPFEQPKCPKCGSLDIQFEGWDRGASLTTAAMIAPLPIRRDTWKCNACGAHWQEVPDSGEGEVEEEPEPQA